MKGNYRWSIAGLLFFAGMLNYLDRAALSVVAPLLKAVHIDDCANGLHLQLFSLAIAPCALSAAGRRTNTDRKRFSPGRQGAGRCSAV